MVNATQLYINGKFLCQKGTGVQKLAFGISLALQKTHPEIVVICPKGQFDVCGLKMKRYGWGSRFSWEQLWLPLFILFHPHSILINFCNSAPLLIRRQIVTIHDLAFLKEKTWFNSSFRRWYKFLIPCICRRSLEIITVSNYIKKEILNEYYVNPEKLNVVPNGVPEMEFDEINPFPFRYLFLTGIYNPRKNATFVISQLAEIKKRNYHIVGVGADERLFGSTEFKQDENLHLLKFVDDKKYYSLMKHASALVFPSEYEGFGIPVLEALVLGTPVVVPDLEIYRESFGELPMYYDAGNAISFLEALDKINNYQSDINELSHLKNKYTFDNAAEILSDIIKCYQ